MRIYKNVKKQRLKLNSTYLDATTGLNGAPRFEFNSQTEFADGQSHNNGLSKKDKLHINHALSHRFRTANKA